MNSIKLLCECNLAPKLHIFVYTQRNKRDKIREDNEHLFRYCGTILYIKHDNSMIDVRQFLKSHRGTVVPPRGTVVPRCGMTVPLRYLQNTCGTNGKSTLDRHLFVCTRDAIHGV